MGTTLRLPYSVSVVNQGGLRLEVYNPKTDNTLYAGGGNVAEINAWEGDYGYDLQFTVTDVDGDAFNLTGATVSFRMAKPTDSSLVVDSECTLDNDPTSGRCNYTVTSGDFDTEGYYEAELQIDVANKLYTIGDIEVYVKKNLPLVSN